MLTAEIMHSPVESEVRRKPKRIRARRIELSNESKLVSVTANHIKFGSVRAFATNISIHGLAIELSGVNERVNVLRQDDSLFDVTVACCGVTLYHGKSTIRSVLQKEGSIVIGLELSDHAVVLEEIYHRQARENVSKRWTSTNPTSRLSQISSPFKAWIADLRDYLETSCRFLDDEEGKLKTLDKATRERIRSAILDEVSTDIISRMNLASKELTDLVCNLTDSEHAIYREFCKNQLNVFFARSPFLDRAFRKPLGYAGDYEMMNMLYREPLEGESLFGQILNKWVTNVPAALANKNRVSYINKLILANLVSRSEQRMRIASVGCGPAREIDVLLRTYPELGPNLDIVLIDQDEGALTHCDRTLSPLAAVTGAKIQICNTSIRNLVVSRMLPRDLGTFNFVYSAGLFDYLHERAFSALLRALYSVTRPQGYVVIGNVAARNPSRYIMEYFTEWFLNHRSEENLLEFGSHMLPAARKVDVGSEELGVNLFLTIAR